MLIYILNAAKKLNIKFKLYIPGKPIGYFYRGRKKLFFSRWKLRGTNSVPSSFTRRKLITHCLLGENKLPHPKAVLIEESMLLLEDILKKVKKLRKPLVAKPMRGEGGKGISVSLVSDSQLKKAVQHARKFHKEVIVEEYTDGSDYRIIVFKNNVLDVVERIPANITGDRIHTIKQLIEIKNKKKNFVRFTIMGKNILIFKSKRLDSDNYLINHLNSFARGRLSYTLNYYENIEILLPNKGKDRVKVTISDIPLEKYNLVCFRGIYGIKIAKTLARFLQYKKKKFFDTAIALPLYSDKLLQTLLLQLNNFPTPKTIFLSQNLIKYKLDHVISKLGLPLVMKSSLRHKGKDNYLLKCKKDILQILKKGNLNKVNFIFQEYIPNHFDYRLLVLGNKVKVAEKRIRQDKKDHRNNVAVGAKEEFIAPSSVRGLLKIATEAANLFKREIAGVDIIVSSSDSKPYILEVNATPAFTYDIKKSPEIEALNDFFLSIA
ncbi:hypothetical protein COY23_01095 [bacterium (Candidatus Torokbacteria) CG_4_10_14_0_2_um_filter_35_8]|nr:MAG: hypothetical protein COY23_01095 [bacterium (Candidatus Torokbacteria) CG_4_10_14_0_2_um_filter_35_8]